VNYHSVTVAGDVLAHGHLGSLVKVAYINFELDESQGNPIVAYPQRHGSTKSPPVPITIKYRLTSDSNLSLYRAPSTNEPYSKVSGDFNPIHTNPYFAAFVASLPCTITNAATRRNDYVRMLQSHRHRRQGRPLSSIIISFLCQRVLDIGATRSS
jgi:fatty acid synthase subunit alpha, fungi type